MHFTEIQSVALGHGFGGIYDMISPAPQILGGYIPGVPGAVDAYVYSANVQVYI